MVKHFNVIMAAVISGTVALFTSFLGISGTVIGSVLSTFLYQLLSGYSEEKIEEHSSEEHHIRKPRLANEIVYIFPLVVIGILELIFVCSLLHYKFDMLFDILESAVSNNLFRLMGIGLIILGAYPFFNSNDIDKRNGLVVLVLGILLLFRGLVDISDMTYKVFTMVFAPFDMIFGLAVVIAITFVILNILIGSDNGLFESNKSISSHKSKKPHARKIDTSFEDMSQNNSDNLDNCGFSGQSNGPNYDDYNDSGSEPNYEPDDGSNYNTSYEPNDESNNPNGDSEQLPLYEEEVILVNNPDDPDNPIKKTILKRIKTDDDVDDDYQDMYIIEEPE